jgi:ribose 5-phosphate isomerase B
MKPLNELKIAICSDHAGFELKKKLIDYLKSKNVKEIKDFGAYTAESSDYPIMPIHWLRRLKMANMILEFPVWNGNGINMTVNKHKGIRAALCWMPEIASLARRHNNANVLSLPARFIDEEEAKQIVNVFFETDFEGGRHQRRIDKISC